MDRRTFLRGSGALACCGAFPTGLVFAQGAAGATAKVIDAHCHVFNAKDLPVEDFLKKIVLGDVIRGLQANNKTLAKLVNKYWEIPDTLINIIASVVKAETPGIDEENKFLSQLPAGRFGRTRADIRKSEIALIQRILFIIWTPEQLVRRIPKRSRHVLTNTFVADLSLQAKYLVRRELYPQNSAAVPDTNWEDPAGAPERMEELATALYDGDGPLGHMLRWAVKFTRYRIELVAGLHSIYGDDTELRLATPAQVDFEKWVYDVPHRNPPLNRPAPPEDQVDMLERLSRKAATASPPIRIHGFVAYDPLRQVLFEKLSAAQQKKEIAPFDLVVRAVTRQGFIGVKLYPPMGFRAIGNKGRQLPRAVMRRYNLANATIGADIDKALLKLFVWCRDNNVPVMAHANQSNGPYEGGSAAADPGFWSNLIDTTAGGSDFKSLRINLAHFGGFEETLTKWSAGDRNAGPDISWEWKIGNIRQNHPDARLFSDISYLNEVLQIANRKNLEGTLDLQELQEQQQKAKDILAEVKKHFIAFKNKFSRTEDFLLFGSDWLMLGEETGYPDADSPKPSYGAMVRNFLVKEVGYDEPAVDKIMFGNAVKFLGLNAGEGTRLRLQAFCGPEGSDWLKAFDPVA